MPKLFFWLIGGFVLTCTGLIGWGSWVNAHRIMAGPANESTLYQSYNPEPVVHQFRYEHEISEGETSQGASQGIKSIHHSEDFIPRFTMRANREQELVHALREDILLRLRTPGITVVAANDAADGGFTYQYATGNSRGSISVQIPFHQKTVRRYPVPSGLDDVNLKIALDETWTRPASETRWWMSSVD